MKWIGYALALLCSFFAYDFLTQKEFLESVAMCVAVFIFVRISHLEGKYKKEVDSSWKEIKREY